MADDPEDWVARFFHKPLVRGKVHRHTWPNHCEYHEPPLYKHGETAAYNRDALYIDGKEFTFEMIHALLYHRTQDVPQKPTSTTVAAPKPAVPPVATAPLLPTPPTATCPVVPGRVAAGSDRPPLQPPVTLDAILSDDEGRAAKRQRVAPSVEEPPPPPPPPPMPVPAPPQTSRIPLFPGAVPHRSSVGGRRSSLISRPGRDTEEDEGAPQEVRPQLGDDTLQFFDNMEYDVRMLSNDSVQDDHLLDDLPGDDSRRLTAGLRLSDVSAVPERSRCSLPAFTERSTLGEETSGFVGRQVARLFDKTMDESSEPTRADHTPARSPHEQPRPLLSAQSPVVTETLHTAPPTESTLFTMQERPPAPVPPLEIFEEFSELTVPNLQSTTSTINDTRCSLSFFSWEREEEETPASLLAHCRRLSCDQPLEAFTDLHRHDMYAAVSAALSDHPMYHRELNPFGDTSFLPPFVPDDHCRRLKVPQCRPTLQLGAAKFEVLHRLAPPDRPPLYSVRCPNPPPPDCRPRGPCPVAVEAQQELCLRELSSLKLGPPQPLRWEFYVCSELKSRIPVPERRRFLLPFGESYEFPDLAVLQLACNPNPTLEEFFRLVQGRETISEDLVIFWAVEMLKALEVLINADIVHGAIDLCVWRIRDFAIEDSHWHGWAVEGAVGWEYKGLTLTDFSHGIDLRLFAQPTAVRFVGGLPDHPQCPEQASARPWRQHVDAFGVVQCLYQLLLQRPIQLQQVTENGVPHWRPTVPVKRWQQQEVWHRVFTTLLNLPPIVPPGKVEECRRLLEGLLKPSHRATNLKTSLKDLRIKVWGV